MRKHTLPIAPHSKRTGIFRLWPFLKPQMKSLLLCLLMALVINIAELLKPYILKIVIDRFLTKGRMDAGLDSIFVFAFIYLACTAVSSWLNIVESVWVNRMGQTILMDIRRRVFGYIQHMSIPALDRFSSGRLITRATNDVETLNELFSDVLVNLFKDALMLAGIVTMMLMMNWRFALVAFATVPIVAAITLFVRQRLRANFVMLKALIGRINGFFAENIAGMRVVQIFRNEAHKLKEFDEMNTSYYTRARFQVRMNSLMRPLSEMVNTFGIALLIWYGLKRVGAGVVEIGLLYAFIHYIRQFFEPINDLAEKYTTIASAAVSADRIFELLDNEDWLEDTRGGEPIEKPRGKIEFERVWFAYEADNWVLKDVSFVIRPGESAAFVGETGAGKTTILSLLMRFYEIQKGRILLDGQDIREIALHDLRGHIAVVLQDVFLFSGSITENIRLGDQRIDDRLVERALAACRADGFIRSLDGGMEHPVAERGATFSAGQRQLLSLARALAHDPIVIVLDEATASIDTDTEQLIQDSLQTVSRGRTTIIIAHRLSTIRECDAIHVLGDGQIVESGNHNELLRAQGVYAQLNASQNALGTVDK